MSEIADSQMIEYILGRLNVGVVVVDRRCHVVLWNRFMETHTGVDAANIIGGNIFDSFPELPRPWLEKKLETVFLLGNYAFTNWQERPYFIRMPHNRPITGGVDCMRHNCTFLPIRGDSGKVEHVCIAITDVTDMAISEARLQEAMRRIEVLSTEDPLTGLYNRRQMHRQLELEIARVQRYGSSLSLVFVDFDHFKDINDSHGHLCGDHVLQVMARRFQDVIRDADVAARYGGEEFALILPMTDSAGAVEVAERARSSVESTPVDFEGASIEVTISAGVAELAPGSNDAYALIGAADRALYRAKKAGRNCVRTADE